MTHPLGDAVRIEVQCAACAQKASVYPRGALTFTFALPHGWRVVEGGFAVCSQACAEQVRREMAVDDVPF